VTFSLVACDLGASQWGVAVASKFLAVGSLVPWARGDVGAVATQAWANVSYGPDGIELLASGLPADDAIERLTAPDQDRDQRQLGIVDAHGGSATFTGAACMDWAGGKHGPGFAAQGNILAGPRVVDELVGTFLATPGTLAERMLHGLLAADRAGGDRRGRQSAALIVRQTGGGYGGTTDILVDLRVDDHPDPIPELHRIHKIHDLLFGKTPEAEFLPLEGALAEEVRRHLDALGYSSVDEWASVQNLEERLDPSGRTIDPKVLDVMREQGARR
jgi:uncharacterized Ntn-hydrolase superfamily protein